jgi:hypothetical protein
VQFELQQGAGFARDGITRMPASDSSMPATWRSEARSRSMAQEHSSMNSGIEELSSTALTAVVLRSRVHQALEDGHAGERKQQQQAGVGAHPRALAAQGGQGERRQHERRHRPAQKFSVTGSKASRSARPAIQLPAHSRLAKASSRNAAMREVGMLSV